ncbi:MAG: carbohydrate ABC transporter permease [Phycisphaerales bacterium]|nr:carbohydrate ABC transporter permease [Phycisphaerales bacterium]
MSEAPKHDRTHWGVYMLLLLGAALTLVPFLWLVCGAFKRNEDFFTSTFLPRGEGFLGIAWSKLTLDNFRTLLDSSGILRSMLNSVFLSSVTAVLATLVCAAAGFALAKHEFRGRRLITAIVLVAVIVPPTLLLAPGYQLLFKLDMLNSFSGLVIPALAPAFGVYLFRQAASSSVPNELIEAARIDGCGELRVFFTVAMPLLRPMAGAFMLITFLGVWNNFINPQIVLQSESKLPLAVAVSQLRGVYYQDYGLQIAGTLASVVPVLALFLLLQREFISGLTSGAVKE